MFEQQIETIKTQIIAQTIGENASIKLHDLVQAPILHSVKVFFLADASSSLEEEYKRILSSPRFDYTEPSLHNRIRELTLESRMQLVYKREDFLGTVDRGTKLIFNFMCRPQWTLTKFIFGDAAEKTIGHILHCLEYFDNYAYYKSILEKYFAQKPLLEFPRRKFSEIVHLIDDEVIRLYSATELSELTRPLFDLFSAQSNSDIREIPIEALHIFFDDKNNSAICDALHAEMNIHGRKRISFDQFQSSLLTIEYNVSTEVHRLVSQHLHAEVSPEHIPADLFVDHDVERDALSFDQVPSSFPFDLNIPAEENTLSGIQEVDERMLQDEIEGRENLKISEVTIEDEFAFEKDIETWEGPKESISKIETVPQLLDEELKLNGRKPDSDTIPDFVFHPEEETVELPGYEESTKPPSDSIPKVALDEELRTFDIPSDSIRDNIASLQSFATAAEEPQQKPALQDLHTQIKSADKKRFVKKLFNRDEGRYMEAIDMLNTKYTWKEASEYIDEIFINNNADMYSRVAVKFTDEIYRRYSSRP